MLSEYFLCLRSLEIKLETVKDKKYIEDNYAEKIRVLVLQKILISEASAKFSVNVLKT